MRHYDMTVEKSKAEEPISDAPKSPNQDKVLEVIFVSLLLLALVAALFEALTYRMVAARPPLIIIGVSLLLVFFHGRRLYKDFAGISLKIELPKSFVDKDSTLRKVSLVIGFMFLLVAGMVTVGQNIAVGVFIFALMYFVSKERLMLSLQVSLGTVVTIYLLFEWLLEIELYRGIIYLLLTGHRIF
jgi:hypothetical protein